MVTARSGDPKSLGNFSHAASRIHTGTMVTKSDLSMARI